LSTCWKLSAPATHHVLAHDVRPIDLAQLPMNFDWRYALCIQKLYHWPHFTVGRSWNKSLHLQQLQRCYCGNAGNSVSARAMLCHCSTTYVQSLRTIYGLLAVGRVGNLLKIVYTLNLYFIVLLGKENSLFMYLTGNKFLSGKQMSNMKLCLLHSSHHSPTLYYSW
jgi:hypothetical protein